VDLSDVSDANLSYWTWYDIEEDWDYAYLLVSTDRGEHWSPVPTTASRTSNPTGQNLGNGFTGKSGGGEQAAWVAKRRNLALSGQKILLRFAMQNDLAVNEFGFAVDDISIEEIGWSDDVESNDDGWEAGGFVRTHNRIPQVWRVRAVEQGKDGSLRATDLDIENGSGEARFDLGDLDRLVVFVIGQTRYTNLPASYRLELGK
jgi:hypothetical protein